MIVLILWVSLYFAILDQIMNQVESAHNVKPSIGLLGYVFDDLSKEVPLTHINR